MGPFIIWGRAMGATTALLIDNPYVIAKIVDSPYESIKTLCNDLAHKMKKNLKEGAFWIIQKLVNQEAGFDINEVDILQKKREFMVSVLFAHAENDKLIPIDECRNLFEEYESYDKKFMKLQGGHNSKRKLIWIGYAVKYALQKIGIDTKHIKIHPAKQLKCSDFQLVSLNNLPGTQLKFEAEKNKKVKKVNKSKKK